MNKVLAEQWDQNDNIHERQCDFVGSPDVWTNFVPCCQYTTGDSSVKIDPGAPVEYLSFAKPGSRI